MESSIEDIDYVEYYANKLKSNPKIFEQQKDFIECQMNGSSALFKKKFSKGDFKEEARKYLKGVGLI